MKKKHNYQKDPSTGSRLRQGFAEQAGEINVKYFFYHPACPPKR